PPATAPRHQGYHSRCLPRRLADQIIGPAEWGHQGSGGANRAMPTYLGRFPRAVWLLLLNTLGAYTGYGVVLLVYNLYLVALGYHEDFIGLFTSVNAIAMIAGSLGAIGISQRWG